MGLESSDEVAMFFIDQEMQKGKIETLEKIFAQVDKVKADDIRRVAKEIFQKEKMNLAVIGPHKNEEKLKNILK
jgi:predicted Zn-dependent peptidase